MQAKAPASTANLGPGFDAAAAALDLWNEVTFEEGAFSVELEGEGADELPRDATHLALRAFAVFAPPERYHFRFMNRIPLERGLGSSAAAIGLGLVAGAAAAGRTVSPDELLGAALGFEGHADNLAAVLNGGVCLTWQHDGAPRARRIASDMPATPILAIPSTRTSTAHSRNGLPATIAHGDAAANAGAATLLGAAIVAGDAELLRHAFHDRLHEQYRAAGAPLLAELRSHAPAGAVGVTLSGSGPSVVVWADKRREAEVVEALAHAVSAGTRVVPLRVVGEGARVT
ncbi:MAG TPA: homoserine kinase [Gaiellaceae bacterium]|nr:homoserine kinase [Gaiellaceae bacterium]